MQRNGGPRLEKAPACDGPDLWYYHKKKHVKKYSVK